MKKVLLVIGIALVVTVAVLCVPLVNNAAAAAQLRDMQAVVLPPQTDLAETVCEVGRFVGTGDGAQYFTAMVITGDLEQDALCAWYSPHGYTVEQQVGREITVVDINAPLLQTSPLPDENYYLVYQLKDGIPPFAWLDFRGC